jgi:hypothetical protein
MIRKSGGRFSEKIMLYQNVKTKTPGHSPGAFALRDMRDAD